MSTRRQERQKRKAQARRGAHRRAVLKAARKARDPARRTAQARAQRLWEVAAEYLLWCRESGDACPHEDIRPIPGDEDWGRCVCGDEGYPLTERAAYGDVQCSTCKDTGMVPADLTGQTITHRDGTTSVVEPGHFADARCPDCRDASSPAAPVTPAAMTHQERLDAAGAVDLRDNLRLVHLSGGYARAEPIDPTKRHGPSDEARANVAAIGDPG